MLRGSGVSWRTFSSESDKLLWEVGNGRLKKNLQGSVGSSDPAEKDSYLCLCV